MSRNGSGIYSLAAGNPVVTGTTVSSTWANSTLTDIASALTTSIASDGQTVISANIPLNNNKITGLANGTVATDAAAFGQVSVKANSGVNSDITYLSAGATNYTGFKNRIINGAMVIDQRNAGATQTIANGTYNYTVDRWRASSFGATCVGQQIFSTNQYLYQFTGAASVTNIDFNQRIESKNCLDLASQTVTLSVQLANSLLTSVSWQVAYATATDNFTSITGISSGTFTVNSTLTTYSIQVALPANAINGIVVDFTVGAQTSGTWKIGNVQLEKGSTATSFDYRPYGTELSLCQRYLPAILANNNQYLGVTANTTTSYVFISFPTTARVSPTGITIPALSNFTLFNASASSGTPTSLTFDSAGTQSAMCIVTTTVATPTLVAGQADFLRISNANGYILFNGCEL